jgi:hypothetical protein
MKPKESIRNSLGTATMVVEAKKHMHNYCGFATAEALTVAK